MHAKTKAYTKKVYFKAKGTTFLVFAILPYLAKINNPFIRLCLISTVCMMPLASLWGAA